MNRRTLLIIASVVVLIGLVAGAYFLFFANGPTLSVGTPGNPFGSSDDRPSDALTPDGQPLQGAGTVVAPRLIRITDIPVAKGAAALYIPPVIPATSTDPGTPEDVEVRFIERQSGNIYAFRVHDRLLTRISNRTIPGIQEAVWSADGARAFVRYLARGADGVERVDTYALPADGGEGYFLEAGVSSLAMQGSSTVFSLLPNSSGSIGSLSNTDGTNARTLFTSAISRLTGAFSGGDIVAYTNPSSGLDGYAFLVSRADGSFSRLLGPLRGLAALPNSEGTAVLYSYVDRNRTYLQSLDLATRSSTALPLSTLAEKCAWAPGGRAVYCAVPTALSGNIPDDWYQGARTFSDRIWRIDLSTRLASLVVDPGQVADVAIDAVSLTIDSQADTLVFTNKKDGSLWVYDL
ncbi:MAG TPA: hypothetical protein PK609_00755 [Candidatus Paceibacterota bacterium]|nr:hypothetical protein [Candidatus Paceibacterota bacterium]